MWIRHSRVTLLVKLTDDADVELIVLYRGLNLNLTQTAVSPAHEKKETEANPGVWGASKDPVLKWEQGAEGGVGAEFESAACELGSFVLTEWLYAGVQFKCLAKAQLLSFAVWIKGEKKGWGGGGVGGWWWDMTQPSTHKGEPQSEMDLSILR